MLTTPAIQLLQAHQPGIVLGVVVEPAFRAVYEGMPGVEIVDDVRRFRPDLTINLHGGTRSALMTLKSGARWRAGFAHYSLRWIYNLRIPRAQEILGVDRVVHTAEHVASAMFWLGVPATDIPRAKLFSDPPVASRPYAVIHPFASAMEKQWPAERFAELAATLELEPVFIGTAADDFAPFKQYRCVTGSLNETKRLLAGASLFIGNDSGPAHMAAAFGLPVLVLFGPSNEVVWAPWRTESRVLKSSDLTAIPVTAVREAVADLRSTAVRQAGRA